MTPEEQIDDLKLKVTGAGLLSTNLLRIFNNIPVNFDQLTDEEKIKHLILQVNEIRLFVKNYVDDYLDGKIEE